MAGMVKQNRILAETTAADNFAREFNAHSAEIQRGLYTLFKIPLENLTLHTDSIICMYWAVKSSTKLGVYVWNRCKILQETGIEILRTDSDTNPADLTSKVKPVSAYINNPFW